MSGHATYEPANPVLQWLEKRLPIGGLIHSSFIAYPTPRNLNYWWTFGGILSFMLGVQILTGIILAMHYTPHVDLAFRSVEAIMRDVNFGWLLRYLHANGAAMFFLAVYIHMFRGMYYGSYKEPREVLWILGVILYLLMMATGFMGYVLVWGQMSFWAATVITNLFSAIPGVGDTIVTWLWGGYAVGNPTLNRFYSLHYLLPFVIAGVVVLHVWALHVTGQNNPAGIEPKSEKDTVPFTPYATVKDAFIIVCFCILFAWFVFYIPNYLGHADNYIPGQSGGDAAGNRAGMVLPAILRHPALYPEQAAGRLRAVRFDPDPRFPALARHLEGALGALPAVVQAVLLAVRDRGGGLGLARLQAAGGHLCRALAHLHVLLLRLFPDRPAAARHLREDQAAAEFDFGIGSGRQGVRMVMNIQRSIFALVLAGSLTAMAWPASAQIAEQVPPPRLKWSFAGPFGKYDEGQLQRGFKIYKEVCANCHSLDMVSFRNLADAGGPGFTDAQVEALAADYKIKDLDDQGNQIERAGRPADHFPAPFANELAAKAANGVAPPDMSTLAKARSFSRGFPWFIFDAVTQYQEQGPDYIAALISGFQDPPKGFNLPANGHYNEYFPGHNIAMPPPLQDGQVTYDDGTPQTVAQYSKDVAAFMMWAAEPHLDARKRIGFQVMIFLIVFAGLMYFTKKKVWSDVH